MKFVVKPPSKTTTRAGSPCQRIGGAVADAFGFDGIGGGEAVGEAGTHHAGKGGDEEAFFQIEFLDRGALLLFGHFALFHRAGGAGEDDAEHADADADRGS